MSWLIYLVALAAGAANPFQSGTNSQLNKQLGQPIWAGIFVYASGLAGLLLVQALVRQPLPSAARAVSADWWAWTGGLISIVATMAGLTLAHRLGSGVFTGLTLTASMITSVLLDHFALAGFRQHSVTPLRGLGCGLLVVGIWLVSRF